MSVTALPSLPVLPVRTCSMASPEPLPSKEASLEPGKGKQGAVPRYYLHHCYIWLGTVRVAPIIYACGLSSLPGLINLAEVLGAAPSSTVIVALLLLLVATLAVCAVVLGVRAWEYRYTWYEFDETEFSFYSGILSKHRTHVPYAKIQSVNERASLLQRLAGVCTVAIDTAGGANNKAVMVSYVERSAAEYLRRELFLRKQKEVGAVPSDSAHVAPGSVAQQDNVLDGAGAVLDDMRGVFAKGEVDTGLITCEYGLGNKELFLSALCGKSSFAVALLTVIAAVATVVSCFVEANLLNDQTAFFVTGMAKQHVVLACALVGLFVVGCLIAAWALCLLATCLSYGGFRARRRGSRIEVERGLIIHVFSGIDVDRIRLLSVIMSTWLAAVGILVYEQGFGFIQLYTAPNNMTLPAVAAILIGGASVNKASIPNVIIGTILFQGIVTMTPTVLNSLIHMDMSEVIRMIVSNGMILYALTRKTEGSK